MWFLLGYNRILDNEDRKPIKRKKNVQNRLERILCVITCIFANYCINNTFNKANWKLEDKSALGYSFNLLHNDN